ncbi:MAG TPA: hypothetical protein VGI43_08490 [Mucilaginibacter sp.]|jgi:DNA-binding beta-propeller fold protein YncE
MKKSVVIIALLWIAAFISVDAQNKPDYSIAKTFHIKSGGGYDYLTVDSASDNLYISHGSQVNVLNKMTGDSIAVISTKNDAHGITLVHALGKGYISNGSANSVLVFDLKTNKVLRHVSTGKLTDRIFYDDFSKKVISCNGKSKNLTVIDPATDRAVATIQLTGWPETAVSDGAGKIYVNNTEKSEIDVIDAVTYKILKTWPVAPGISPTGLAIDRQNMLLFSGCNNKMLVVMNARNGKIVNNIPIDEECDAVDFDVKLKTVYASNGVGTLSIIKEVPGGSFLYIVDLKTQRGARTMAIDQITHRVYLPTGDFKQKDPKVFRPSIIPGTFRVLVVAYNN